jgi:hypothetical protein
VLLSCCVVGEVWCRGLTQQGIVCRQWQQAGQVLQIATSLRRTHVTRTPVTPRECSASRAHRMPAGLELCL